MLNLEDLEILIEFSKYKTLTKTAESLMMSQPSLSRIMQRLEQEFEIELFDRKKNSLSLNKNGEYAVKLAKDFLEKSKMLKSSLIEFDRKHRAIDIDVYYFRYFYEFPLPLDKIFPNCITNITEKRIEDILDDLNNSNCDVAFLPYKMNIPGYNTYNVFNETLCIHCPNYSFPSNKKSLSFAELNGKNFFFNKKSGYWYDIIKQKMPLSHFIEIPNVNEYYAIMDTAPILGFTTNLFIEKATYTKRTFIPISDPEATINCYMYVNKKEKRADLSNLIFMDDTHDALI